MKYRSIIFLLAIVPSSFAFHDDQIYEYMSSEEVQQLFHTDRDSVPKYEIVKVHLSERSNKRDLAAATKMYIRAFGGDINLWLHPRDSDLAGENTPTYFAMSSPNTPEGVTFARRDDLMPWIGRMVENEGLHASFVIGTEDSGHPRINGHIASKRMVVRSLPPRVAEEYRRRRRSIGDSDDFNSPYHVVFKTTDSYEGSYSTLPVNATKLQKITSRSVSKVPDILYPEILIVVEHSMYRTYGTNYYGLLEYLLAFWNGVDLKFRSLESPKIRLFISGIILGADPHATPYIINNSLGNNVFESGKALDDFGEFFYALRHKFRLNSYDIVVTMTRKLFGLGNKSTLVGKCYAGQACNHFDGYTSSMALIQDDGVFRNIIVAAHELGHLFGSEHDGADPKCSIRDGYIMTPQVSFTQNSADFSNCSVYIFDVLLRFNKLDCLFNKPNTPGKVLPRLMPGRMMNLDEQCRGLNLEGACQSRNPCVNMYCLHYSGECVETKIAASDGTNCGDNKFCLHMQCVSL